MPRRVSAPAVKSIPAPVETGKRAVTPEPRQQNRGWTPKQPALPKRERESYTYGNAPGATANPLFVNGVAADDATQGDLGDCFLISSLSALALTQPDVIKNAIKDNGDGTFTVRLYERHKVGVLDKLGITKMKPVDVTVDGSMPSKIFGSPVFAHGEEAWPGLIEKAAAQLLGGYDNLDAGGQPDRALEMLTGKPAKRRLNALATNAGTFRKIERALSEGKPVVAATRVKEGKLNIAGLDAHHAYTVLRAFSEGGKNFVELRNPYGMYEPTGPRADGKFDGVFTLTVEEFRKNFGHTFIGR